VLFLPRFSTRRPATTEREAPDDALSQGPVAGTLTFVSGQATTTCFLSV
jgi:hypothetical protein